MEPERFTVTVHASRLDIFAVWISAFTLFLFSLILWYTRKAADQAKRANDRVERPLIGIAPALPKYVYNSAMHIETMAVEGEVFTMPVGLGPGSKAWVGD